MKVFFEPILGSESFGVRRIHTALTKYFPPLCHDITTSYDESDLKIFFVCGRHDHLLQEVEKLWKQNKKYIIVQLSLQSTRNPNPIDWLEIWNKAEFVWSYYRLPLAHYYFAPLGVESDIFFVDEDKKFREYLVLLTGIDDGTCKIESHQEVRDAAERYTGKSFGVVMQPYKITDNMLRHAYNNTKFVSCLRRKDGFELPGFEGLLCGARPIVYDHPRYRDWYVNLAEYISEDTFDNVVKSLVKIFSDSYRPVTREEQEYVKENFNWKKIIKGFWDRLS